MNKVIWLTGLPCSGKTTIGKSLKKIIKDTNIIHLDGDIIRDGLCKDLKFQYEDRAENIRRVAEISKLLIDQNCTVICSFVSPLKSIRKMAKNIIGEENFKLVFVNAPILECFKRDVKGMYKKSENGEIENFTGVQSKYECPEDYDIMVETKKETIEQSVNKIIKSL